MLVFSFLPLLTTSPAADSPAASPAYPGQPKINAALKKLAQAQKLIATSLPEAIFALQDAEKSLSQASHDKGTFAQMAERLTGQAIRHLQKDDAATAYKEIDQAIDAAHKAGKTAAR
jgi:hypothetical protein